MERERNKKYILEELEKSNRKYIKNICNLEYDYKSYLLVYNLIKDEKAKYDEIRYFILYTERILQSNPNLGKELIKIEGLYKNLHYFLSKYGICISFLISKILCIMIDVNKINEENIDEYLIKKITGLLNSKINPLTFLVFFDNRSDKFLINYKIYEEITELLIINNTLHICNYCVKILKRFLKYNEIKNYMFLKLKDINEDKKIVIKEFLNQF